MKRFRSIFIFIYLFLISDLKLLAMDYSDLELQEIVTELANSNDSEKILNKCDLIELKALKNLVFFKLDQAFTYRMPYKIAACEIEKDWLVFGKHSKYKIRLNKNYTPMLFNKVFGKNYELKTHNTILKTLIFVEKPEMLIFKGMQKLEVWDLSNPKPKFLTEIECPEEIVLLGSNNNIDKNKIELFFEVSDSISGIRHYLFLNLNLLIKINEKIKEKELEAAKEQKKQAQTIELIAKLFSKRLPNKLISNNYQ